jgi:hypothetical protein
MFQVERGYSYRNIFSVIYGQPGCGKTHLASQSESALIADLEDGSSFLDTKRVKLTAFDELLKFIKWAGSQDEYKTIVFDSLTAIERYATAHVLKSMGWASLETPGYGKGYAEMCDSVKRVLAGIEYLRDQRKKDVILIAHARVRTVIDPSQESYDRWEFDCYKNLTNPVVSMADAVMYLRPAVHSVTNKGDKRTFASGRRELLLADKGGALAKNRLRHMPELVEFEQGNTDEVNEQYKSFWNKVRGAEA